MTKWLVSAVIGAIAITFAMDVEAQRRLGGGKTLGKPSQTVQQRQALPPQQQTPPAQQAAPVQQPAPAAAAAGAAGAAKAASPWRGALMGLAAGLGLAALASWLGFGDTLAMILLFVLIGLAVMMLIGFFLRRSAAAQPAYQGAGGASVSPYPPQPPEATPRPIERAAIEPAAGARRGSAMDEFARAPAATLDEPWGIPADFDAAGFLANARTYFGKLQAAWDSGNLDELSDFTTNDMFTALTHELRARTGSSRSEIVNLDAKLLGIETQARDYVASVRFTGTLRSESEIEPFDEVWNLSKPIDGKAGWLLAGIQQLS